VRKCPYCDFNSHEAPDAIPEGAYVTALLADLDSEATRIRGRSLQTIFFGGGTPSLFRPAAIGRLLEGIAARVSLADEAEITLEANPGAVDAGAFPGFRSAGVNRLSIGVQSFRDDMLARMGRVHDAAAAARAVRAAQTAGFANVNLDLMFGLPGDTLAGSESDLSCAIAFEPAHISWYQLSIEPNTVFGRRPPVLPDEDLIAAIQDRGLERLANAGYERYEISAYARPSRDCRHNLNYWEFGDYLGIGAGAHGKITLPDGSILRTMKRKNPLSYLREAGSAAAVTVESVQGAQQRSLEFLLNALRLVRGFDWALFEARTGLSRAVLAKSVGESSHKGLLEVTGDRVRATASGLRYLNDLLLIFTETPPAGGTGRWEMYPAGATSGTVSSEHLTSGTVSILVANMFGRPLQ
jgi:oxygen-independent coproporphyrinogen-3 oxidase